MAMIELWDINRVLRWTGFRLIVQKPTHTPEEPVDAEAVEARNMAGGEGAADADREVSKEETTKLGLLWVGLYGSKGWMKWEPWTRPFWARWRNALADKLRDTHDEAQAVGESAVTAIAEKIAGKAPDITSTSKGDAEDEAAKAATPEKPRKSRKKRKAPTRSKAKPSEPDEGDAEESDEDAGAGPEHGDTETEGVSPYEN